jgi:hypothetical protein
LGNIDELGINRSEVMTALMAGPDDEVEALKCTSIQQHVDKVVAFAQKLDHLFNE